MKKSHWTLLAGCCVIALTIAWTDHHDHDHSGHDHGHEHAEGGEDMAAMMEAWMKSMQPNENHKLLEKFAGKWDYTNKYWMDPSAPPQETKGKAEMLSVMDGRYIHADHKGYFMMPGPDGSMTKMDFHGAGVTGYDNIKKKWVNSWIDNFGTGILMSEGTYDAATKTWTYHAEMPDPMGNTMKIKEVIRWISDDKHVFEWHEERGGEMMKTMEITYTRA